MSVFNRTFVEGCGELRSLDPELAKECEEAYWRSRTAGLSDEEVMAYLSEGNAERGKAHLIDPVVTYGRQESLH